MNSIGILVLSCYVEDVDSCCKLVVGACQSHHEGVYRVATVEAFVIEDAAERKTWGVCGRVELGGQGQDYFGAVDDG